MTVYVLALWDSLTRILHQPTDPASIAITRIILGIFLALDVVDERGMSRADARWGNPEDCHFPLFSAMQPPSLSVIMIMYAAMFICCLMMSLGLWWRFSCTLYVILYWYILLLDKSVWNNHSYLFGLLATIMLCSDPHRAWSIDGVLDPSINNSHVPKWSLILLRFQIFILYFLAGIKKLDADWISGYSMKNLSQNWIFTPLRLVLTGSSIEYFVVHHGGLMLDLCLGFMLLWPYSRRLGLFLGAAFNLMNMTMFNIGMFPWVCLATMPLFCDASWPRNLFKSLSILSIKGMLQVNPNFLNRILGYLRNMIDLLLRFHRTMSHLLSNRLQKVTSGDDRTKVAKEKLRTRGNRGKGIEDAISTDDINKQEERNKYMAVNDMTNITHESSLQKNTNCIYSDSDPVTVRQRLTTLALLVYVFLQLTLPFSHPLTQGYTTWTDGPYGYSWDMMVHSWNTLHVKITVKTQTGEYYIDPKIWSKSNRWMSQADMASQYARCIGKRLENIGMHNVSLYFDVWRSLNGRFQQRIFDPNIDMLTASWSPWVKASWVLPVLEQQWRESVLVEDSVQDVVYVADFPGLTLQNYISDDLENVTLKVFKGQVYITISKCELGITKSKPTLNQQNSSIDNVGNNPNTIHKAEDNILSDFGGTELNRMIHLTINAGESSTLPVGCQHEVTITSDIPAFYTYSYVNRTAIHTIENKEDNTSSSKCEIKSWYETFDFAGNGVMKDLLGKEEDSASRSQIETDSSYGTCNLAQPICWNTIASYMWPSPTNYHIEKPKNADEKTTNTIDPPSWTDFKNFVYRKIHLFQKAFKLFEEAVCDLVFGLETKV